MYAAKGLFFQKQFTRTRRMRDMYVSLKKTSQSKCYRAWCSALKSFEVMFCSMFCTNFKHNPLAEFALHSQCVNPICSFVLRCFGEHQLFNGPARATVHIKTRGVRSSPRQADPDALCSPSSGASTKPEEDWIRVGSVPFWGPDERHFGIFWMHCLASMASAFH